MRGTIITTTRTGGQGKTRLTEAMALGFEGAGAPMKLVAIDSVGADRTSKLGKFCADVQELRIAPDLAAVRRDPRAVVSHWDALGDILLEGNALIDVGANVVDSLFDWATVSRAGDLLRKAPPITIVVPTRAQGQAVEDALHVLDRTVRDEKHLPVKRRVLVLNEASGNFDRYGTREDFKRLAALKDAVGLKIVRLGHCNSELWPLTEREYLPFRDIVTSTTAQLRDRYGLNPFEAARAHADLLEWLDEALRDLRAIGVVPNPVAPAASPVTEAV